MLMVTQVKTEIRKEVDSELPRGLERVNDVRSELPAITHVDYSARLQTVDQVRNPFLWNLLHAFCDRSGCPALVNTSFNVRDEPIVCSWADAVACFLQTNLDLLLLDDHVLQKCDQGDVDKEKLESIREAPFREALAEEKRQTAQFVISICVAIGLLSVVVFYRFELVVPSVILFGISLLTGFLGSFGHQNRKWIENNFKRITLPIRLLVTLVLLALVYYLVVTPIGFLLRLRGRDIRKATVNDSTQWSQTVDRDLASYFHTY